MFVGRRDELAALRALASYVTAGHPAAAVVVSEPGLGKTRLLAEVGAAIDLPSVRLHGYEPARKIPFAAAGGLLRELARVPEAGARLDGLFFGEAGFGPGLQAVRVFEAALRCLVGFGPLAVLFDDLQWADRESLALVHYLLSAAQPAGIPLLVLCASRPATEAETFSAALAALLGEASFASLKLGALNRDDGIELVLQLAPQFDHTAAEELWRRAQGSPFWLGTLVREAGTEATPDSLIRSRFLALDADSGRLFALLVIAARPIETGVVAELLDWPEERVRRAALILVNRALAIQETGMVRVAHDLIREVATRELPDSEQRRLHGRLAAWLEAGAGEDLQQLSRALEHRQAAGLSGGELALRIARAPQRRLLGRAGLAMLAAVTEESAGVRGLELQHALASLASELGEWSSALNQWAGLADWLPGQAERTEAALAAAEAAFRLGLPDRVYAFASRARALAPDDPLVAIEADVREGQALRWLQNRVSEAKTLTDRAGSAARELARRAGGVDVLSDGERRVYVAALRAQLDEAIRAGDAVAVAHRAAEISEGVHEPLEALTAAFDVLFSLIMFEGLPRQAESRARSALQESRRAVLPIAEVEASHWLGWALHDIGQLEEAEKIAMQTVALAERVGAPVRFSVAVLRANAYYVAGSRGKSQSAVAAIAEQVRAEADPHYRLNVRMMHVPLLLRFSSPRPPELEALLTAMRADIEAAGCERCRWQATLITAEARARMGDIVGARAGLADWDAARPEPRPGPAARRAYVEALVEAPRNPKAAQQLFQQACELAERAGQSLLRLWIELDAAVELTGRDRLGAIDALRSVAESAEAMGAFSEQQLAVQHLRALGVRTWRRSRTSAAGRLSSRERQIAELVAGGASNPDIAQTLFLSRKTVERHVTHILAKLDVRNRVELAALFAREVREVPDDPRRPSA